MGLTIQHRIRSFVSAIIFISAYLLSASISDHVGISEDEVKYSEASNLDSHSVLGFQEGWEGATYSAGRNHVCWISQQESVNCQGENFYGQLGTPSQGVTFHSVEVSEFGKIQSLSSGFGHTCSISDRSLVICWGYDLFGQSSGKLGNNDFTVGPSLVGIGGDPAISISSGKFHSCALTLGGSVWCWGIFGENMNNFDNISATLPMKFIDGRAKKAISISSGDHHSCSIMFDRTVSCWGDNSNSQISPGTYDASYVIPVETKILGRALSISLGGDHSCVLAFSGELECWGDVEDFGFKKINSTVRINHNLTEPIIISSGQNSICILQSSGLSNCWGIINEASFGPIYPSLSIGFDDYCYVELSTDSLSCSRIGDQESGPNTLGKVLLTSFDSDEDGILNHADDFPHDSERSIICNPGSFGFHHCEDSPKGTFVSGFKSVSYQYCPFGKFQPEPGQNSCIISPPGTYVDLLGAVNPIPCPVGTYSNESGSKKQNCIISDPGYWAPGGTPIQFSCPAGTFQPFFGQGSCLEAGKGNFTFNDSSVLERNCPSGEFQNLSGQNHCKLANPGHYVSDNGSSFETPCPSGTYNPNFGALSINSCIDTPPGTFSKIGYSNPENCSIGTFQPDWSSSTCIEASPGYFVESEKSTSQEPCGIGFFQPEKSNSACLASPPGFFVDIIGSSQIYPCPAGSFQPNEGRSECNPASPGFFVNEIGSAFQEPCPEGTYNANSSAISILQCQITPSGNYSQSGSESFIPCPTGSFQTLPGQSKCMSSDIGFFVDFPGSSSQFSCPDYSSTISNGSTSVNDCLSPLPGNFKDENNELNFSPCPLGKFQPLPGQTICLDATPGNYVDSVGATEQTPCPPGTYSDSDLAISSDFCQNSSIGYYSLGGAVGQTPSPAGHYVDSEGASSPSPCPAGTFSPTIGATSISACQESPIGTYSPIGSESPILCQPGTFQPLPGQPHCLESSPGNFTNGEGETRQLPCIEGFYQPNYSSSSCIKSQLGFYVENTMSSSQTKCPDNSTTLVQGSISITECTSMGGYFINSTNHVEICPLGTFQPLLGQEKCLEASPGNYVDSQGSLFQSPCPEGSFTNNWSSISIEDCQLVRPGHYLSSANNSEIPCPTGSYQPYRGMSECLESDPGYYSVSIGSTSQLPCELGTFQSSHSSSMCFISEPGHYVDSFGSTNQIPCLKGTYQPNFASFECLISEPGSYVPSDASQHALPCPAGTYQPNPGSSSCIYVSEGYFAPSEGGIIQKMCPAGTYRNSVEWLSGDQCLETPPGRFSFSGSPSPILCPPGTFSPEPGSKSSSDCLGTVPGTYVDKAGSSSPILCPPGKYQPGNRATSCIDAPEDTFVSEFGSATFRPCTSGGYTLQNSSTSSTDCIFDQDGDGKVDSEDRLVHIKGDKLPLSIILYCIASNVALIAWISIRGD